MKALTHDGRLTDALAAVLGYLRAGEAHPALDAALRASADAFVELLAEHLRAEEDRLFPSLREANATAEEKLRPAVGEHASLRAYASELARRVAIGDREEAAEVATSFLAALAGHLEREERAVDALLTRLEPEATDRVLRRAGLHRPAGEEV